jgi:hypothetical protein
MPLFLSSRRARLAMQGIPGHLNKLYHLDGTRKRMLVEASFGLAVSWCLVRGLPFRFWARWLGEQQPGERHATMATVDQPVREICWAVKAINRGVGGRFTCLMLAAAAQWMLSRRHIPCSLVLGTRTEKDGDNRLAIKAHAWLMVGPHILLGEHGGRYTAVSSFIRSDHSQLDG